MVEEEPPEDYLMLECGWHVLSEDKLIQMATKAWTMSPRDTVQRSGLAAEDHMDSKEEQVD